MHAASPETWNLATELTRQVGNRAVLLDVISAPTASEGTVRLLRSIGLHPFAASGTSRMRTGDAFAHTWISAIVGGVGMGQVTVGETSEDYWTPEAVVDADTVLDDSVPLAGVAKKRATVAEQSAFSVVNAGIDVMEVLTSPPDDHPSSPLFLTSTVGAWWNERLAEGHTPESARFLLTLVAAPSLLAYVRASNPDAPFLVDTTHIPSSDPAADVLVVR